MTPLCVSVLKVLMVADAGVTDVLEPPHRAVLVGESYTLLEKDGAVTLRRQHANGVAELWVLGDSLDQLLDQLK